MNLTFILQLAVSLFLKEGPLAVQRFFTPPQSAVESACRKMGTNVQQALEERDEMAKAWAQFVLELAGSHSEDNAVAISKTLANDTSKAVTGGGFNFNILDLVGPVFQIFGKSAVTRMLTVPMGDVKRICDRTGANYDEAIKARTAATEELVEFIQSLMDKRFVDPD